MIPTLLAAASLLAAQGAAPPPGMKTFQFVMLKKGKPVAMTAEESQKTMQAHLAHLEDLWIGQGKAVLLGPMMDDGDLRGIVVLDVPAEEAKSLMAADSYVKIGAMVADIRPILLMDKVMRKPPKFLDLSPYTLGFFKRPDGDLPKLTEEEGNRLQAEHLANNNKMREAGLLVWAGPFLDGTSLRGLLVFRSTDQEAIKKALDEDVLVKRGRLIYELHPAMTAKGAFPDWKKPQPERG